MAFWKMTFAESSFITAAVTTIFQVIGRHTFFFRKPNKCRLTHTWWAKYSDLHDDSYSKFVVQPKLADNIRRSRGHRFTENRLVKKTYAYALRKV